MIVLLAAASLIGLSGETLAARDAPRASWSELTELPAALDAASAAAPTPQYTVAAPPPPAAERSANEQWVAIEGMMVDTEYLASGYSGDESGAFGMSFGAWWWQPNNLGGAIESSWIYDSHSATSAIGKGNVDTWDLMLGGRFGVRSDSDRWVVYGKGGVLYRVDDGNHFSTISSDGWGGYIGAGVELRLSDHFAVAPDFMWTFADVAGDSRQFIAGVSLVVRF